MRITATAPGKVVLLGEYAVLSGAPALVMAANRRAEARLESTANPVCSVSAPGYATRDAQFRIRDGAVEWCNDNKPPADYYLPAHVIDRMLNQKGKKLAPGQSFDITLCTDALYSKVDHRARRKLGLGSSAALTVALATALAEYVDFKYHDDLGAWFESLRQTHSEFQRGAGSGLDIAASVHGGMIEYQLQDADKRPRIRPLPTLDFAPVFVWTGRSAPTCAFLKRFRAWREAAPKAFTEFMTELGAISNAGIAAVHNHDLAALSRALNGYGKTLQKMADASELEIYSPEHHSLAAMAKRCGVAYKPCGAGGGDIGTALSTDRDALGRFSAQVHSLGCQTLELEVDQRGVQIIRRQR